MLEKYWQKGPERKKYIKVWRRLKPLKRVFLYSVLQRPRSTTTVCNGSFPQLKTHSDCFVMLYMSNTVISEWTFIKSLTFRIDLTTLQTLECFQTCNPVVHTYSIVKLLDALLFHLKMYWIHSKSFLYFKLNFNTAPFTLKPMNNKK